MKTRSSLICVENEQLSKTRMNNLAALTAIKNAQLQAFSS